MFKKKMKNLEVCDIAMIKLAVFAGALFLMTVWPAFAELVYRVHWGWYLGAMILFMLKPGYKFWLK
jgi:hypothetical protein